MYPNTQNTISKISEQITKGNSGIILIPQNPTVDAIAAATSLYIALTKANKSAGIACSTQITSDLLGADKIQQTLSAGGENLVVSFPYTDGTIDKIDYNIAGSLFNLVITPRPGYPKLNPDQVKYSYTGGQFDFIITIDTPNLNALGQIYTDNQSQIQGKNIINIDRHLTNGFFGTTNMVNKTASSTSELVYKVIEGLSVQFDKDISTNLYTGIASATNNFTSYSVNAETFETIAKLMKAGAVKKTMKQSPVQTYGGSMPQPTFNKPVFQPQSPQVTQPRTQPVFQPPQQGSFQPSTPAFEQQNMGQGPIESVEHSENVSKEGAVQTPQDWLKPKIFKGTGLV